MEIRDTIVAISTPPGRGGIGIVRLSGPDALAVAAGVVVCRQSLAEPEAHARAYFARVLDPDRRGAKGGSADGGGESAGELYIDDCLVTAFHAPHSYTGETLVEIATHGSPVILEAVLRGALAEGARLGLAVRLAEPGEFTQRAFVSGRIDLTQAEAVHDLIAARTLQQVRVAAQQLGGALARRVGPAKEALVHLIALLEAGMDFASGELDDVDIVPKAEIARAITSVREPLERLAATFERGQLLRNGAAIAIVGRPNAGKSSLFNRLLERDRAIVTAVAGTTRDTLEESLSLNGVPLRLIDTAGLRVGAADEAEQHGIARTREALADADLVLHIVDVSATAEAGDVAGVDDADGVDVEGRPHLVVENKIDLLAAERGASVGEVIRTSALTGEGLDELRTAMLEKLNAAGSVAAGGVLNTLRQQQAVLDTLAGLAGADEANRVGLPHEVVLMDLHNALRGLDALTGVTTSDDILARIFSTFCIGK